LNLEHCANPTPERRFVQPSLDGNPATYCVMNAWDKRFFELGFIAERQAGEAPTDRRLR
jgi:hypothetical protein